MRATEFLRDDVSKNKWELIVSNSAKHEIGADLIQLVQNAYAEAPMGSFVKTIGDVLPSDWLVYDWDDDPELDCAIFYRDSRANESWDGKKIQGIGHDGQHKSKVIVLRKLTTLLNLSGNWIEASDTLRSKLQKINVPVVKDEEILRRLFSDKELTMTDDTTYKRRVNNNTIIETVFGKPLLRKHG